jgi:predicted amidohydrolase YtcJ
VTVLWEDLVVLGPDGRPTGARAFVTRGPWVAWVGRDPERAPRAHRRLRLGGRRVSPGFVDAHVHLTGTGLALAGVDLSGARSAREVRALLARRAAAERGRFLWGGGWDDARPDWRGPGPRSRDLDQVAGDRFVYLARVDGHSAVVSSRLLEAAGCAGLAGADRDALGRPTGVLRGEANHAARRFMLERAPASVLRAAHRRAASAAAAAGITTVHEMSGPNVGAGERDLDLLLGARARLPVDVVVYYATEDLDVALARGLRTVGGDLVVDGSLGSRTAALHRPYADAPGQRGLLLRDAGDLAELFERATRAGLQAGVHCIGEAACEAAVAGLERAARRVGLGALRRLRHRLEHFEMASPDLLRRAARLGAGLSLQPAFDARWGGEDGMYARRVGRGRARRMNHFRAALAAGCLVGFGSDAPVTPFDPLGAVRAAVRPSVASHALPVAAAFRAATLGAAALAREEGRKGRIAVGYRADLVVWNGDPAALDGTARVAATVLRGRLVWGSL